MLSKKFLEKFKALYRKKTGKDLPGIDALDLDTQMTTLVKAIYKPTTKEEDEFVQKIRLNLFCTIAEEVNRQFKLDIHSLHGIHHWVHVREMGFYLAQTIGADFQVVDLFSTLHDSQRENEDYDPNHGFRAAEYVQTLFTKGLLPIDKKQLGQLKFACAYHSERNTQSNDITIQTCWDADRLDLWRVNITPDEKYLHTNIAKEVLERMKASRLKIKTDENINNAWEWLTKFK